MIPKYTLDKIKFGTDRPTFEKAVDLYENGKVMNFKEAISAYTATVMGTKPYNVFIENRNFTLGHCTCYLGQNDTLCKHLVALAIYVVKKGQPLTNKEKQISSEPKCSNQIGEPTKTQLAKIKKDITSAIKYIKPYDGPSSTWFRYQDSLSEGCNRLSKIVSELPVSKQTTELLIGLLLRLDKKLCYSGVDDSDGTVGDFMYQVVQVLMVYTKLDSKCREAFAKLKGLDTCFSWEEPLVKVAQSE